MTQTANPADIATVRGAAAALPHAYVINLARTPERLARFLDQNAGCGIAFTRFDAADGNLIGGEDAVRLGLIKRGTKWRTAGTIGVALSHRNLWQAAIDDGRPRLVFEDDVYIREDAAATFAAATGGLATWDIILLGYNIDALVEFNVVGDFDMSGLFTVKHPTAVQLGAFAKRRDPVNLFRLRHAFGISAYAISPPGARKLLAGCFPMDNRMIEFKAANNRFNAFSLDCMMNVFYRDLDAYLFVGPLALPLNDWEASTVDRRSR
jgi:GR25 family glycosyltransferase involved in LPS biosynthesis